MNRKYIRRRVIDTRTDQNGKVHLFGCHWHATCSTTCTCWCHIPARPEVRSSDVYEVQP